MYSYAFKQTYALGKVFNKKDMNPLMDQWPNMPVDKWTPKSPKEIFEEGNYMANYQ